MKRVAKLLFLWLAKYSGGFALARRWQKNSFAIVAWHGVSMDREHEIFPEFFVSQATLRKRLQFLTRHFHVISLDEAVRQHHNQTIQPGQVVLTFDDGVMDFALAAVPILEQYGCPATVYVNSSRFTQPMMGLRMAMRELFFVTKLSRAPEGLVPDGVSPLLNDRAARKRCGDACGDYMRTRWPNYHDQLAYAKSVAQQLELDWDQLFADGHWDFMQQDDLKRMVERGFDVQLHSHLHLMVSEIGDDFFEDTRVCREMVEATIGRPAQDYCYPSGAWNRDCWPKLERAGVRSAVTCKLGPNFADTPPLALRRSIDHEGLHALEFESIVTGFDWWVRWLLGQAPHSVPTEAEDDHSCLY